MRDERRVKLRKRLRRLLQVHAAKAGLGAVQRIPLAALQRWAPAVGDVARLLAPRERRRSYENLRSAIARARYRPCRTLNHIGRGVVAGERGGVSALEPQ